MTKWTDKFNVPGNVDYDPNKPLDNTTHSVKDYNLRGYWITYDKDGQLCFVSDQSGVDGVTISTDGNGVPVIHYTSDSKEFQYDGVSIRIKRYS